MAVLLKPLPFELPTERPDISNVEDFRMLSPERLEMTVSTDTDALLTVSIINYPGWSATVNGKAVDVYDNYAGLIGIPIRAGRDQEVILSFDSPSLKQGRLISLVSLVVMIGIAIGAALFQGGYFRRFAHRSEA
jgi:uncharacterized membrane protein YfhO